MTKKQHLINLNNEFDSNLLIKDIKKYNNVKSYIDEDADNPKVKYYVFVVNEDNKIVRDNKGRTMKQNEFQELVINEFKEQKKFNEQQLKFNEFVTRQFAEQKKFNESFSKRLDSIEDRLTSVENKLDSVETRLTKLESFHKQEL
ncbi:hypothetical protein LQ356_01445 [Metamycoplasma faucium]|uniref:DUF16 domain-containing protein n=1 Tax=Metamycoplasma faucium TaxID=56142 RepID=A0ABZ2TMD9_9BACT